MSYTKEEAIESVEKAIDEKGHSITARQYEETDYLPSLTWIQNNIGSWKEVKKAAGGIENTTNSKNINTEFFKRPLSNKACYWLGYIYGDGSISKEGNTELLFQIKSSDEGVIQRLKEDLSSNHKITSLESSENKLNGRKIQTSAHWQLSIGRTDFVKTLYKLGVKSDKTHSGHLPEISTEQLKHFTRGLFDADGSADKSHDSRVRISGSELRMKNLGNRLPFIDEPKIYSSNNYSTVNLSMIQQDFYEFCYPEGQNTRPSMPRKRP